MLKSFVIDQNKSTVRDDALIQRLRAVALTREEFRLFAAQRAYIATNFVRLLQRGAALAEEAGETALVEAFVSNLNDELGYDAHGQQHRHLHHGNWKASYLEALGLEADIDGFPLLRGTQANVTAFLDLESTGDVFEIAGAILSLENIIPLEYRAAVAARDGLFPEVFSVAEGESDAVARRKHEARIYMDDHIVHDSRSHFPDMLKALLVHEDDPAIMARVKRGIEIVNRQRKVFYENVLLALTYGADMQRAFTIRAQTGTNGPKPALH